MKVINGHTEVLIDDDGSIKTARELVDSLVKAGNRLAELEEQLKGMKVILIRTTDNQGHVVVVNPAAVATVTEAGVSSQYYGTRSIIRLLDGRIIESKDTVRSIEEQMSKE